VDARAIKDEIARARDGKFQKREKTPVIPGRSVPVVNAGRRHLGSSAVERATMTCSAQIPTELVLLFEPREAVDQARGGAAASRTEA
jgi:hypothetical protein